MAPQQLKGKTLGQQRVAAYVRLLQENEDLWKAVLVFLGALFIIGSFPFYPVFLIPVLALVCGVVAYRVPYAGTLLSFIFVLPAIAYQSAIFGWLFLLIIAFVLFEMFENWAVISALEVLIFAPFAFATVPFFGWITILGMAVSSLHFGSKKSMFIAVPSVLAILFLSSVWLVPNNAYMPLKLGIYQPGISALMLTKSSVGLLDLPDALGQAVSSITDFSLILQDLSPAIGQVLYNLQLILFADTGLIQLFVWAALLWAMSSLSGFEWKRMNLISSLLLILVIPVNYLISQLMGTPFNTGVIPAVFASMFIIGLLEEFNINLSRESEMQRSDKLKTFGKFGFQDMSAGKSEKSLADVGDYEDVKQELRDAILLPLKHKEIAYAYNMKPPSGILLFGPPGTGKTMLMRALAKELKYNFVEVKCSDILSQWYGESEKNVTEAFADARKIAPTILFFDEIDNIGKKRGMGGTDEVTPRVLSTLLQEMDGAVKTKKSVIVVGTTNVPNQLDAALLRPGRFDKIIYMHLPDKDGRKLIIAVALRKVNAVSEDVDLDRIAAKTERFSGADLVNIVTEATQRAAKEALTQGVIVPVSMSHLTAALAKVKPSTSISQIEEYDKFKMDFERSTSAKEEKKEREDVVKWEDVGGLENVKGALLETIELPLLREDLMKQYKIKPSKGILLFGPPGTGKTLIVRAASNELKASFQALSAAELMKLGYTQAVTVIKDTFNRARENTPSIIFIDEIETFAPARTSMGSSEILGQLLNEMDGLKELKGVVIMAATNKPSLLDAAILRPGRFDKIFYIPPPDKKTREAVFKIHLGDFGKGMDLGEAVVQTEGFSGADIAGVVQEAKMTAVRSRVAGKETPITAQLLLSIIAKRRPSITKDLLMEYERFRDEYGERG